MDNILTQDLYVKKNRVLILIKVAWAMLSNL